MPIEVTRVYRSEDEAADETWIQRDFGYGTRLSYDIFLYSNSEISSAGTPVFTDAEISMPDGAMVECTRTDGYPSTDYVHAQFECASQPTGVWFKSTIAYNQTRPGWDVTRKDGTVYAFAEGGPLVSISDRFENFVTISRGGAMGTGCTHAIPANAIDTSRRQPGARSPSATTTPTSPT